MKVLQWYSAIVMSITLWFLVVTSGVTEGKAVMLVVPIVFYLWATIVKEWKKGKELAK